MGGCPGVITCRTPLRLLSAIPCSNCPSYSSGFPCATTRSSSRNCNGGPLRAHLLPLGSPVISLTSAIPRLCGPLDPARRTMYHDIRGSWPASCRSEPVALPFGKAFAGCGVGGRHGFQDSLVSVVSCLDAPCVKSSTRALRLSGRVPGCPRDPPGTVLPPDSAIFPARYPGSGPLGPRPLDPRPLASVTRGTAIEAPLGP